LPLIVLGSWIVNKIGLSFSNITVEKSSEACYVVRYFAYSSRIASGEASGKSFSTISQNSHSPSKFLCSSAVLVDRRLYMAVHSFTQALTNSCFVTVIF